MLPSIKVLETGNSSELQDMVWKGDLTIRDADNNTLLHHACMLGNIQAVRILLECGIHVDAGNVDGHTPLCDAALSGSVEVISMLLNSGACANPPSYWTSPIVNATQTEHLEAMRLLIQAGSNVDSPDRTGFCPLHIAIKKRFYAGIKELLLSGANPNQPVGLLTPLHMAAELQDVVSVKYLLACGANPNSRDQNNRTPSDYVREAKNPVLRLLLEEAKQEPLNLQSLSRLAFWRANRCMDVKNIIRHRLPRFVNAFLELNIL